MLAFLGRISNRTAYVTMSAGIVVSLTAAFLSPQDERLGGWVRLAIWHGMLKWACIVGIFGMGAVAAAYLVSRRERLYEWARALQFTLLPMWALAVVIGAVSAKLIWNSWNLGEPRMVMSVAYTMAAAVALIVALMREDRRLGAAMQIATACAIAIGLLWVNTLPAGEGVHPASAVLSSDDLAFKVYAFVMMAGCLVWVLATAVPVRRWLARVEGSA
jgi:tryptophan-rich sensory protein